MQTLEEQDGLRTFHSRNSHSSEETAGGTGEAAGIARKRIHLYCSRLGGGVKESIESLIAKAVANRWKCRYPAHKTQQDHMKRLLLLALTAATLLMGTTSSACEKHLNGHQNGSDTDLEGGKK